MWCVTSRALPLPQVILTLRRMLSVSPGSTCTPFLRRQEWRDQVSWRRKRRAQAHGQGVLSASFYPWCRRSRNPAGLGGRFWSLCQQERQSTYGTGEGTSLSKPEDSLRMESLDFPGHWGCVCCVITTGWLCSIHWDSSFFKICKLYRYMWVILSRVVPLT